MSQELKEWDEKDEGKNGKGVKEVQKKSDPLFISLCANYLVCVTHFFSDGGQRHSDWLKSKVDTLLGFGFQTHLFQDVPKSTKMCQNVPTCSKVFQTLPCFLRSHLRPA